MTSRSGNGTTGEESLDEIRDDIVETREALAETVEALAAKADVKGRTKARVNDVGQRARQQVIAPDGRPRPYVVPTATTVVLLAAVLFVVRRRRER